MGDVRDQQFAAFYVTEATTPRYGREILSVRWLASVTS
jgi:hypothetical protein